MTLCLEMEADETRRQDLVHPREAEEPQQAVQGTRRVRGGVKGVQHGLQRNRGGSNARRRRTCRRRSAPSGWPPAAASHAPCRSAGALAASPRARPPSGAPSRPPLYPRRRGPPVRERGTECASRGSGRGLRQKRVRSGRTQVAVQGTVQTLGSAPALRAAGSANARLAAAQTSVGVLTRAEMSVAA